MILRKPYAFFIKHFRLIHLILALPLIYIVRKTHLVVDFFNTYVSNGYAYQTGSDVSGLYINWFMLFLLAIIIAAILSIYYLLKYKEKPVKMYVVMLIYYIILFVMLFWYSGIISKMATEVLSAKTARLYRDISLIIYIPQYIFIVFVALRAIGFNIKQFNFQTDLKEMQITSEDSEEVEVGLEFDTYKTKRFLRRYKREFMYYLIENKLIVSIIFVIVLFSSIIVFYKTRKNYNLSYSQNQQFNHQGFTIKIEDSIISNIGYNGKLIDENYYYLALKTYVKNNYNEQKKLDYDNFIITGTGTDLKPVLDRSTYFLDYASPYYGDYLKKGEEKELVLVYKLKKDEIKKSFKLKLLSSYDASKEKLVTKYAIVNLSPVILDEVNDISTVGLNNKITFSNTNVGNTILTIYDYLPTTSYTYDYQHCYSENNCVTKKDIASIDYTKGNGIQSLLVLGYDYDLDHETTYYKYTKNDNKFFSDFVSVKCSIGEKSAEYNVIDVTPKTLTNKLVLQVKGDILSCDKLSMLATIRNKRYTINLK